MDGQRKELEQLDQAIDRMDLEAIGALLDRLDEREGETISPEDPALFAARIRKLHREKERIMKHFTRKTILIAACLAAALSVGVYASGAWTHFDLFSGGRMVTVTTGDASMTEKEARELVKERTPEEAKADGAKVITLESQDYATPEAAAAALGIPAVMPKDTAKLPLDSVSAQDTGYGKNIWVTYGKEGKILGVTILLDQPAEGATVVSYSDIEGETLAPYKSAKGDTFTRIRDENGDYAVTRAGDYQYVLIFAGFNEQEIRSVIDSADLSAYR